MRRTTNAAAAALWLGCVLWIGQCAGADQAAPAAEPKQASIAFFDAQIWNWRVLDNRTVLIETQSHKWYKGELLSDCIDLPFVERLGFKSNPDGSFDKFSWIEARGQRCQLISLVASAPPPKKNQHSAPTATTPAAGAN